MHYQLRLSLRFNLILERQDHLLDSLTGCQYYQSTMLTEVQLLCPFMVLDDWTKEKLNNCLEINHGPQHFVRHGLAETVLDAPLE
jgi:hypothetical protein